jgi:intracellular septation protein
LATGTASAHESATQAAVRECPVPLKAKARRPHNSAMRMLIDFLPIGLFFAVYKMVDIYAATAVLMAATLVQMAVIWRIEGKLSTMHRATLALVLVFGALTLVLRNEDFIKWKPTFLYAGMSLALTVATLIGQHNPLQKLLGTQLKLPTPVWGRLTWAWAAYFAFMSALNAFVAYYFTTDEWVDFKIWGYVFPLVFILGQALYISRHIHEDEEASNV